MRLSKLEKKNKHNVSNTSKSDLVSDIETIKKDEKNEKLNKLSDKYKKIIHKKIKAKSPSEFITNISKVVKQTVKFVEKNVNKISDLFDVALSSTLKLSFAIKLINSIINGSIDINILTGMINNFVDMLYNKKTLSFKKLLTRN